MAIVVVPMPAKRTGAITTATTTLASAAIPTTSIATSTVAAIGTGMRTISSLLLLAPFSPFLLDQ
jgi:hypothetical protein